MSRCPAVRHPAPPRLSRCPAVCRSATLLESAAPLSVCPAALQDRTKDKRRGRPSARGRRALAVIREGAAGKAPDTAFQRRKESAAKGILLQHPFENPKGLWRDIYHFSTPSGIKMAVLQASLEALPRKTYSLPHKMQPPPDRPAQLSYPLSVLTQPHAALAHTALAHVAPAF